MSWIEDRTKEAYNIYLASLARVLNCDDDELRTLAAEHLQINYFALKRHLVEFDKRGVTLESLTGPKEFDDIHDRWIRNRIITHLGAVQKHIPTIIFNKNRDWATSSLVMRSYIL